MPDSLSPAAARRVLLAAQGFGARPTTAGTRQLNLLLGRLRLLQLDSVNVFDRSHYLPVLARLGVYDKTLLDRLTFARRSAYTEQWAHEAAIVPVADWPLFAWRREAFRAKHADWLRDNAATLAWLRSELAEKGPLTSGALQDEESARSTPWWGWSSTKQGLEMLFRSGDLAIAGRTRFQRLYAPAETVIPPDLLETQVDRTDAVRELVRRSAAALGIGTVGDLADYYRLYVDDTKRAVRDLVDAGELREVAVPGWPARAYLHRDARIPRRIEAAALLSPFDPIVWDRDRALRMFGFHYRIEIYTPAPKRRFGYYTLPVLVDEALVGRVDLKSDRQRGVLRVQSAWREGDAAVTTVDRVALAVRDATGWQGLPEIEVVGRGDLARELAAELGVPLLDPPDAAAA
ncbi:winged helix-turn-helix domain-containing protein [Pseudolysinimonas sp.]|uniref:winged helix-turn-helix domain-containing protein n=1 Tax=Pseudolysinimonas sp. TaxID=2680009 RepID=UPI003F7D3A6D